MFVPTEGLEHVGVFIADRGYLGYSWPNALWDNIVSVPPDPKNGVLWGGTSGVPGCDRRIPFSGLRADSLQYSPEEMLPNILGVESQFSGITPCNYGKVSRETYLSCKGAPAKCLPTTEKPTVATE